MRPSNSEVSSKTSELEAEVLSFSFSSVNGDSITTNSEGGCETTSVNGLCRLQSLEHSAVTSMAIHISTSSGAAGSSLSRLVLSEDPTQVFCAPASASRMTAGSHAEPLISLSTDPYSAPPLSLLSGTSGLPGCLSGRVLGSVASPPDKSPLDWAPGSWASKA